MLSSPNIQVIFSIFPNDTSLYLKIGYKTDNVSASELMIAVGLGREIT